MVQDDRLSHTGSGSLRVRWASAGLSGAELSWLVVFELDQRHGRAATCHHQSQRANPLNESLVRDARLRSRTARSSASSKASTG
jgi:hypothetical protein